MRKLVEFSIYRRSIVYFFAFTFAIGGIISFFTLGQLEDPVFSVKTALVTVKYPGASPEEVEQEVTDRLEQAIQRLPQLDSIYSISRAGEAIIKVNILARYWSEELPQVWDDLRRYIDREAPHLPPGASKPVIVDDFGYVYGFLLALTGDGFSNRDLEEYGKAVRKELSLVDGVERVELWGVQKQAVYLDVSDQKIADLGVTSNTILDLLKNQNLVVDSGSIVVNGSRLRIHQTGEFQEPQDIGQLQIQPQAIDLYLSSMDASSKKTETNLEANQDRFIRIEDIGTVRRGYVDPPMQIMKFNGKPAIGISIAGSNDSNIVDVGNALEKKLDQIESQVPIGINLNPIAWQSELVEESINGFLVNLLQAIAIVMIVLVIPSGARMGLIIATALVLTILGTFIFMAITQTPLQRMSLGALIIALGMMVDNAIVISDTIAVKMREGKDRITACLEASSLGYPLLAATFVAILAFFPIYLSTEGAGEYCQTLFTVVAASLLLSWLIAMMITPVQCILFLPEVKGKRENSEEKESVFYRQFRGVLQTLIRWRYATMIVLIGALILSFYSFRYVPKMFFPDSSRAQMMIDFYAPIGTNIHEVNQDLESLQTMLQNGDGVDSISSFIGSGPPRFYLPVDSELPFQNYGQLIVNFDTYLRIDPFIEQWEKMAKETFPEAVIRFRKYGVGPSNTWPFSLRILGPANASLDTIRQMGTKVMKIADTSPYGRDWRIDNLNRILKLSADYDQVRGRLSSISRSDIAQATLRSYDGIPIGIFRERDTLIPIIVRAPKEERQELAENLDMVQVRANNSIESTPLMQVIKKFDPVWEDPLIIRRNRKRATTIEGAPTLGHTFSELRASLDPKLKEVKLPPGYEFQWDGEQKSSVDAQKSLIPGIVPAVVLIVFLTLTVFNAYRPLVIILLTIPFSFIGINFGLLVLQIPFGFLALLGAMSLAGMMNKNIVVLLDACKDHLAAGMTPYDSIIEASITRIRPVMLAAGTTVLGVIPLLTDVFWVAMAVTIMAGLAFGSLLTLIVVPVLYCILYRIKEPDPSP